MLENRSKCSLFHKYRLVKSLTETVTRQIPRLSISIMALSTNESFPGDIKLTNNDEEVATREEMSPCVPGQSKTSAARVLTQEELDRLSGERALVSDFKQMKLEKEAQKNWDLFYKRNTTNFFKDRHWTTREFEELKACREVRKRGLPTSY